MAFRDRHDAGKRLASLLQRYAGQKDVVVLGLPRGGVPVAFEVARALGAPLDVFVVRKLGVPGHEELAMGAIASGGVVVLNPDAFDALALTEDDVRRVSHREGAELRRREALYRGGRALADLRGRTAILVDDGLATGSTMRAAVQAVKKLGPRRVVVAVPAGSPEACASLKRAVDEVVCAERSAAFFSVGQFYDDFSQTSDDEVRALLEQAGAWPPQRRIEEVRDREVEVPVGDQSCIGTWNVPRDARGVVLFAHGSGSGRFSSRNRKVARALQEAGFATLLLDLLTPSEEAVDAVTAHLRFDIPFLAERLGSALDWIDDEAGFLPIGLFGASTGAAAALIAAARRPEAVSAVVSRGGRPDLAGDALERVRAPTLLLVGGNDPVVLDLNRAALARLRCDKQLVVVPGASHLFEEPGALERVADDARAWFADHLQQRAADAEERPAP